MPETTNEQKLKSLDEKIKLMLGSGLAAGLSFSVYGAATGKDFEKGFGIGVAGASCVSFLIIYGEQILRSTGRIIDSVGRYLANKQDKY